jgi:hypothetical protein
MDDGVGTPQLRGEVVNGDVRGRERRLRRLPFRATARDPEDLRHGLVGRQRAHHGGAHVARRSYNYDLHEVTPAGRSPLTCWTHSTGYEPAG